MKASRGIFLVYKSSMDLLRGIPRPYYTCRRPIPSRRTLRSVDTNRLVVHGPKSSLHG